MKKLIKSSKPYFLLLLLILSIGVLWFNNGFKYTEFKSYNEIILTSKSDFETLSESIQVLKSDSKNFIIYTSESIESIGALISEKKIESAQVFEVSAGDYQPLIIEITKLIALTFVVAIMALWYIAAKRETKVLKAVVFTALKLIIALSIYTVIYTGVLSLISFGYFVRDLDLYFAIVPYLLWLVILSITMYSPLVEKDSELTQNLTITLRKNRIRNILFIGVLLLPLIVGFGITFVIPVIMILFGITLLSEVLIEVLQFNTEGYIAKIKGIKLPSFMKKKQESLKESKLIKKEKKKKRKSKKKKK